LPEVSPCAGAQEHHRARRRYARAPQPITNLKAILERQREAERAGDRGRSIVPTRLFTPPSQLPPAIRALVDGSGRQNANRRYRLLTLPQPGRMARVIREHAAVAANERHDADRPRPRKGISMACRSAWKTSGE
jgi:hypothetical protein